MHSPHEFPSRGMPANRIGGDAAQWRGRGRRSALRSSNIRAAEGERGLRGSTVPPRTFSRWRWRRWAAAAEARNRAKEVCVERDTAAPTAKHVHMDTACRQDLAGVGPSVCTFIRCAREVSMRLCAQMYDFMMCAAQPNLHRVAGHSGTHRWFGATIFFQRTTSYGRLTELMHRKACR